MKKWYLFLLSFCLSCASGLPTEYHSGGGDVTSLRRHPVKQKECYDFRAETSLFSRVGPAPESVRAAWAKWDHRENYRSYTPSPAERKVIRKALRKLPPLTRRVMKERLLGIYFVSNLLGSGLADWVLDKKGRVYCYLIFNPRTLKMTISELITWKEQTCFVPSDREDEPQVSIEINSRENGFLYILLHESTHVVDYVRQITPFAEPQVKGFYSRQPAGTAFTSPVWKGHAETLQAYPFRKKVRFYGIGGPPLAHRAEAVSLYRGLAGSPFFSLYGSLNWAEDLAEFLTFYHLTQKMGLRYRIVVKKGNRYLYRGEPAKNPLVRRRFHTMKIFYH